MTTKIDIIAQVDKVHDRIHAAYDDVLLGHIVSDKRKTDAVKAVNELLEMLITDKLPLGNKR